MRRSARRSSSLENKAKQGKETHLDLGVLGEVAPRLPVVLVERVLDRDDVVLLDELVVELGELLAREPLGRVRVGVLEAARERESISLEESS